MNFKITRGKVIWSVAISLIFTWIFAGFINCFGGSYCLVTNVLEMFIGGGWLLFLMILVIVYIVWSLFQKTPKRRK